MNSFPHHIIEIKKKGLVQEIIKGHVSFSGLMERVKQGNVEKLQAFLKGFFCFFSRWLLLTVLGQI